VPPSFFATLRSLDPAGKIRVVEADFYCPELTALEADTRERNILSQRAKPGNWIVSVDADEYLLDAPAFLSRLRGDQWREFCVLGSWIVVYKELDDAYLVVGKNGKFTLEVFPFATSQPEAFVACRYTDQPRLQTSVLALHFTWARTAQEIAVKASNWSHSHQIDVERHVELWKSVTGQNYAEYSNLHPLTPELWPGLIKLDKEDVDACQASRLRKYIGLKDKIKLSFNGL
jgi:hypothetical protein